MKAFVIVEREFGHNEELLSFDVLMAGKQRSESAVDEIVQKLQSNYSFFDIDERECGFECYDRRTGRLVITVEAIETEYV